MVGVQNPYFPLHIFLEQPWVHMPCLTKFQLSLPKLSMGQTYIYRQTDGWSSGWWIIKPVTWLQLQIEVIEVWYQWETSMTRVAITFVPLPGNRPIKCNQYDYAFFLGYWCWLMAVIDRTKSIAIVMDRSHHDDVVIFNLAFHCTAVFATHDFETSSSYWHQVLWSNVHWIITPCFCLGHGNEARHQMEGGVSRWLKWML